MVCHILQIVSFNELIKRDYCVNKPIFAPNFLLKFKSTKQLLWKRGMIKYCREKLFKYFPSYVSEMKIIFIHLYIIKFTCIEERGLKTLLKNLPNLCFNKRGKIHYIYFKR